MAQQTSEYLPCRCTFIERPCFIFSHRLSRVIVMLLTVALSVMAGLAFRNRFRGSSAMSYTAIASLIMPSIAASLGIALEVRVIDDSIKAPGDAWNIE